MISPLKWIAGTMLCVASALSPLAALAQVAATVSPAVPPAPDTRSEDDAFLLLRDAARKDDIDKADF